MPPSSSDTRARLLNNTAQLFGRYGFTGTGLKAILAASEAPFGSLYHFFPGGKEELGAEAVRQSGRTYLALVEAFYPPGGDVVAGTQQFFEVAAQVMEITEYLDSCQIATVALEVSNTSEPMREACAEAFDSWLVLLQTRFEEAGIETTRACELAIEQFGARNRYKLLVSLRQTQSAVPFREGRAESGAPSKRRVTSDLTAATDRIGFDTLRFCVWSKQGATSVLPCLDMRGFGAEEVTAVRLSSRHTRIIQPHRLT
jgi:TetR/AcrR family transcriptional regulator, lmrAB and yxaGH operons repressor